jgi:putative solute:sodium symporter small subunit
LGKCFPWGEGGAKPSGNPMEKPTHLPSEAARQRYWRQNLKWLAILLGCWFVVSFGCGVLLADFLDRFTVPGSKVKLGFWMAQQGSIYCFVILIAVYARVMNRLDRELLEGTDGAGSEAS